MPTSNDLFEKIVLFVSSQRTIEQNDTVLIGLSGGPDSIFLLKFLISIKSIYNLKLVAAHFDHGWRKDSAKDAVFCKKLAEKYKMDFFTERAPEDNYGLKYRGSLEDLGRQMRHVFFKNAARKFCTNKIALAHHLDDQLENFFIRVLRGAGVSGLAGMRPVSENFIRPLLQIKKSEILSYLNRNEIEYLVDTTNLEDAHLRNRIRKHLIPTFEKVDDRFYSSCFKTIKNLQETDQFLKKLSKKCFLEVSSRSNKKIFVDLKKFRKLDKFLQKNVLVFWLCLEGVRFVQSTSLLYEILRFLESPSGGKHQIYSDWSIVKKKNFAFVEKSVT